MTLLLSHHGRFHDGEKEKILVVGFVLRVPSKQEL